MPCGLTVGKRGIVSLAHVILLAHAFGGGGGGLLHAESAPKTPQLKSSLGKLLMAGTKGI